MGHQHLLLGDQGDGHAHDHDHGHGHDHGHVHIEFVLFYVFQLDKAKCHRKRCHLYELLRQYFYVYIYMVVFILFTHTKLASRKKRGEVPLSACLSVRPPIRPPVRRQEDVVQENV